ncbi:cyclase family protein [Pendulispora rubella]|uniref:Cyclase family protein n=1 Tax=Pendulispora rubella TaxID=2741070 RepID=A0ABZ2KU63_9BACT
MAEYRAAFDFHITFTNGGDLSGNGFRIDVPHADVTEAEVGRLLVKSLGLLMAGTIDIRQLTILEEAHRGSRTVDPPAADRRRLIELSHVIAHGMTTYPGLPGPEIGDHLSREASEKAYAPGVRFHIGRISMVANTGTYVDTPFHRFDDGADLATSSLEHFADLEGVLVRTAGSGQRAIDIAQLLPYEVRGRAVLLHTGWSQHWGTPAYGVDAPFLTEAATQWLVEHGAALVGIDSVNIDDVGDGLRPAHTGLLRAAIPIVEHLTGLEKLPPTGFRFHAAPPRIAQFGTFPVRAYAVVA